MRKGFTLIELLVVVAIIGLLASIVVVSLGTARKGGRDARRQADLRQIQTALELCYDDSTCGGAANQYIATDETAYAAISVLTGILDPAPLDPMNSGTYVYKWLRKKSDYCIYTDLENGGLFFVSSLGVQEISAAPTAANCPSP